MYVKQLKEFLKNFDDYDEVYLSDANGDLYACSDVYEQDTEYQKEYNIPYGSSSAALEPPEPFIYIPHGVLLVTGAEVNNQWMKDKYKYVSEN